MDATATSELYVEWTPGTYHTGVFTTPSQLPRQGFRSVYMYHKEAVDFFKRKGRVVEADQFEVFSDTLFVDFDGQPEAVNEMATRLRDKNIGFQIWESGSKGHHFHVPLAELQVDKDLPAIYKRMMEATKLPIDGSIYRHNGLFRLPGAIHKKTRRPKILSYEYKGSPLSFDINKFRPTKTKLERYAIDGSIELLPLALITASTACISSPMVGNRYMTLWRTAKSLADAGLSEEVTLEILESINEQWEDPKEQEEVERAISEAYSSPGTLLD